MQTFKGRNKDDDDIKVVDPFGFIVGECFITDAQRYTLSTTPFARDHRILTDDNDDDDHLFPISSDDDLPFSVPIQLIFRSPPPTPTPTPTNDADAASKNQLGQEKRAGDEAVTPNAAKKCKLGGGGDDANAAVELGFDTEVIHLSSSDDDAVMVEKEEDGVKEKEVVFDRVSKKETSGKEDVVKCVSDVGATEVIEEEVKEKEKEVVFDRVSKKETSGKEDVVECVSDVGATEVIKEEEEVKEKEVVFDRVSKKETSGKGDGSVTKYMIELLRVLGESSLGKGKEAEDVDFLETAKRKGYTFPKPRFL